MTELEREDGIRYLLGELADAEAERFEDELFEDPAAVEALEAIEAELYEDYACDALDGPRRATFEARFLSTPEGRARLATAKLFDRRFGRSPEAEVPLARVIPLRPRVLPVLAAIAAVVLVVVGASIFAPRSERLVVQLSPALRSADAPVIVTPTSATTHVLLELALDDDPSSGPFVVTWDRDGVELPQTIATRAPGAASAVADVARTTLAPGRYALTLRGSDGTPLARYVFRVQGP